MGPGALVCLPLVFFTTLKREKKHASFQHLPPPKFLPASALTSCSCLKLQRTAHESLHAIQLTFCRCRAQGISIHKFAPPPIWVPGAQTFSKLALRTPAAVATGDTHISNDNCRPTSVVCKNRRRKSSPVRAKKTPIRKGLTCGRPPPPNSMLISWESPTAARLQKWAFFFSH